MPNRMPSPPAEPKLQEITATRLEIKGGFLDAGNVSVQISNIASIAITPESSYGGFAFLGGLVGLVGGGIIAAQFENFPLFLVLMAICIALFAIIFGRRWFQIAILTNAAASYKLNVKDENFALRFKRALEDARTSQSVTPVFIDTLNNTLVSGSPNSTTVVGHRNTVR